MKIKSLGANQTEVWLADGSEVLVSYQTPVAVRLQTGEQFKTEKKWSNTTTRHISKWGGKEWPTKPQEFFDGLV